MKNIQPEKKIAMLLYYYFPYTSGLSVNAKRIAEELVKRGYQVNVFTSKFQKELPDKETINGVSIVRYKPLFKFGKGLFIPQFILNIKKIAHEHNIVNFHLPLAEAGIASLLINPRKLITTYVCDLNMGNGLINKIIEKTSFFLMDLILSSKEKSKIL